MLIDEEFTLKKLEIFLAFMRTGNLARAAAELQTSNVSVHRAIHSLESALRCPLFKHEGRNLTPLESAYVLEERAQKLVADVVDSVRLTREAAGFSAERFKLGSLYSLTVKTVPQLIMGLKIRRSELNIDLILGSNFDLLYKLKNMEVDAILMPAGLADELQAEVGSPALRITRRYYDAAGELLEISRSIHPASRFTFSMEMSRSRE